MYMICCVLYILYEYDITFLQIYHFNKKIIISLTGAQRWDND